MREPTGAIHVVIIKGRVRPGNYTGMAAALILDELKKHPKVSTEVIDPATLSLSYCTRPPQTRQDASSPERPGTDPRSKVTRHLQQKVGHATGVIMATPEHDGSFSSVMKLVIESLGYPSPWPGSRSRYWASRAERSAEKPA
jgi:NAD(P)H-dependent FMN reductase